MHPYDIPELKNEPIREAYAKVREANDIRLERQARRLIAWGYRVDELHNVVKSPLAQKPPEIVGSILTVQAWGDIQVRDGGPSETKLWWRRLWRKFAPYKIPKAPPPSHVNCRCEAPKEMP